MIKASAIAAAGTMAAGAAIGFAPAVQAAPAARTPVVYEASGHAVRPRTLYISRSPAGGSGLWLSRMHWSRWSGSSASGTGDYYGTYTRARVVLSRVETTRTGTRYYTRMKITGGAPTYSAPGRWHWSWSVHEWQK